MGRQLATTNPASRTPKAMTMPLQPEANETATAVPPSAGFDREQAIRESAYACFEARGCETGHELDDWLKAEALVEQANGADAPTAR